MFTISKRQWDAFEENIKIVFLRETRADLKTRWPDNEMLSDIEWMREKLNDAEMFGLTGRYTVRRYFEICLSFGAAFPNAEQYAWARKVLLDKNNQEEAKLDEIEWTLIQKESNKS